MLINKKTALFLLPISFSIFSTSALSKQMCMQDAKVTAVEIGFIESSGYECPDNGNCIRFEYENNTAPDMDRSGYSYVLYNMNLNDGQKGMAMYDMLKTAKIMGYRFEAASNINNCKSKTPSIDSIKLYSN
ncbi:MULTISPECIES: hypothetical protein [unclassified Vibrio]|uniref:hypothetical protein n=1 Tax=unclassified Vibrio TaxID=2614977 RepID=UPI0014833755|nr:MULTISPECIES: hypothetical protein [unclassified Vibrio]MDQ2192870.1 hypothetical protein [Vibrio sp. A14(2019)]MDQ2197965.1 hypothetical protein [Vibrio sp. 2017_1457_11]NNN75956.1 hypothetical protein [Vibrio sp. B7]NNN93864.1 hypothetical protein [Vibrio sp. B8-1]NNO08226.1 hypothetical protein [Vibrio sp. B4-12]